MAARRPSLTVDAVYLAGQGDEMKILLVERKNEPFRHQLALPGGFVMAEENPAKALLRELWEETSLKEDEFLLVPLSWRSKVGRDPRGRILSFPHLLWREKILPVRGGDDAIRAIWIPLKELETLPFDHGAILCEALAHFWRIFAAKSFYSHWSIQPYGGPPVAGEEKREWIVYGGHFFPWHAGHTHCVTVGTQRGRVVVLPDWNPFKPHKEIACHWSYYQGLHKNLQSSGSYVYPGHCGLERSMPTFQWLNSAEGGGITGLLMGDDSFTSLPSWTLPEKFLPHLKKIFIVPRSQELQNIEQSKKWIKQINPHIEFIDLPDHPYRHYSSTNLRTLS